jgi:hypothetical protein
MQNKYEAPELTLIGLAHEVVMGASFGTDENLTQIALDFEFEED